MDLVWEAIFKPEVEKEFEDRLGMATSISRVALTHRILGFAITYREDIPEDETPMQEAAWVDDTEDMIDAYLDGEFGTAFTHIQADVAIAAFNDWREMYLPGTRGRAASVLMGDDGNDGKDGKDGNKGDDGDPGMAASAASVVPLVWEAIAADAIAADFADRIDALLTTSNDRLNRTQIADAIMGTIARYGLMGKTSRMEVDQAVEGATTGETFDIRRSKAISLFASLRADDSDGRDLQASATSAAVAINSMMAGGPAPTPAPGTPDPGTPDPGMSDMSMVSHIDTIRMMDNVEVIVASFLSADEDDYDTSMLLGASDPKMSSLGDHIYTFSSLIGMEGFADSENDARLFGAWMQYNAFGVARDSAMLGNISTFSMGNEADRPTGRANRNARWVGMFRGAHVQHNGVVDAATPANTTATAMQGDQVDGRVTLDVEFDADGETDMLDITFDRFKVDPDATAYEEHMITAVPLGKGGDFTMDVAFEGTDGTDAGMVQGQFYGPAEDMPMEAGGVMEIYSGFQADTGTDGMADRLSGVGADVYHIKGAFGAE